MSQRDINNAFSKKGIDFDDLKKAKSQEEIFAKLSKEDAQRVKDVLNDTAATEKLLNSPAAKALFSQLFSDGKK